jgi:threonine dehydrogenase-like Zn-dependent dehydrogenase
VAVYKEPAPFDLSTVSYGELQIFGTCIYIHRDFIKAVALAENGRVELNPLITHRLPLEEGVKAIESLKQGENAQKILLAIS